AGLAVGRFRDKKRDLARYRQALPLQIVGYGAAQAGIGDVMRAIGLDREIAARELVSALCARFHPREFPRDGEFDRLVVADLEMEEGVVLDAAPVTAVEGVLADEIKRARDIAVPALGEDKRHALGHACCEQAEAVPRQIGRAPFA